MDAYERAAAFFALSDSEKRTVLVENSRGYTPLAEETLDPAVQVRGDTKEGYYIFETIRAIL